MVMPQKPLLIVVAGPTASGKTNVAIQLAKHFSAEILSADSRQIYKELSIGTAKPTVAELSQAHHFFINHISIHQSYDVGKYRQEVMFVLERTFKFKNIAVMVGGTGLYIRAVCNGLDEFPPIEKSVSDFVRQNFEQHGIAWLQTELKKLDKRYFEQVDVNNPMRLIRALEVCLSSEKPFSSFHQQPKNELPFDVIKIGLQLPRAELYERINERVLQMMQHGLEEEARKYFHNRALQALQTVGYTEMFDFFDGKITKETAIKLIQQNTRHYAKRQMTWLNKEPDLLGMDAHNVAAIIQFIETKIKN